MAVEQVQYSPLRNIDRYVRQGMQGGMGNK